MTAEDVIELYTGLDDVGVEVWIDGGWGVDALLGEQTRPHADLSSALPCFHRRDGRGLSHTAPFYPA
jgi:lincosamide nucleotidyltransferase A/C/D/E